MVNANVITVRFNVHSLFLGIFQHIWGKCRYSRQFHPVFAVTALFERSVEKRKSMKALVNVCVSTRRKFAKLGRRTVQHPQSLTFGQVEVNQERSVNLRAVIYAQIQQVLVLNKRSTNRLCNKTLHIMRHYHRYSYHRGVWCLTPSAAYTYVSQFFSIKPALTITKSPCDVSEAHNCHLLTGITKIQHWPKNHLMFFCIEIIPQKSELRHQFNHSTDIISSYCPTLYAY